MASTFCMGLWECGLLNPIPQSLSWVPWLDQIPSSSSGSLSCGRKAVVNTIQDESLQARGMLPAAQEARSQQKTFSASWLPQDVGRQMCAASSCHTTCMQAPRPASKYNRLSWEEKLFLHEVERTRVQNEDRVREARHAASKMGKKNTDVETGVQDMSFPPYIPVQANPHLRTQNTVSIPPSPNTTAFILPSHSFQHQAYSVHTEHSLHTSSTTSTHPTHSLPCLRAHSK